MVVGTMVDIVPPRPWRVVTEKCFTSDDVECWGIVDADNNPVIETDCGHYPPNIKTAELIVFLVNREKEPSDE